ncbi:KOW domain-containing RNA-binding protein [Urinicoccus massiliensis]|uniref:KOW domain-containing RNA-binding protein n=1 Tax=Urinicoccus massiliensis TaxID=1723382 RepID=UPI000931669A|nr:KOW domain-containing RNA-binding protein [Urinicoccus massiliensis]
MRTTSEIQQGQVVRSLAGRDKDRYFLVLEVVDQTYLLLVDGKLRKLARPKKKKVQHVQILKQDLDLDQEGLNDSKIRKALKAFNEPRRV